MRGRKPGAVSLAMLGAALGCIAVLAVLVAAGQRANIGLLHGGWQFAEYRYLVTSPLRTAWLLHVQPPLWNLILGITLWLPGSDQFALHILLALLAAGCAALAARLVVVCGARARWAGLIGAAIGVWPTVLPTLFQPLYELPTSLLLLAALNVVVVGFGSLAWRHVAALAIFLTSLALIRASVHPIAVMAVLVCAVWANRRSLRMVHRLVVLVLPALLFAVLIVKNIVLVGAPTLTSWQGMNLLHSTQPVVPQAVLDDLVATGEISGIGRIPAFSRYDAYLPEDANLCASKSGVLGAPTFEDPLGTPWSDEPFVTNFNSPCFVPLYGEAGRDGVSLIKMRPHDWLVARWIAFRSWFTTYPSLGSPAEEVRATFDVVTIPVPEPDVSGWSNPSNAYFIQRPVSVLALGPCVVITGAAVALIARRRRTHAAFVTEERVILGSAVIYWLMLVPAVVLEFGEQSRFRAGVEQVAVLGAVVCLLGRVEAWRRVHRSQPDSPPSSPAA